MTSVPAPLLSLTLSVVIEHAIDRKQSDEPTWSQEAVRKNLKENASKFVKSTLDRVIPAKDEDSGFPVYHLAGTKFAALILETATDAFGFREPPFAVKTAIGTILSKNAEVFKEATSNPLSTPLLIGLCVHSTDILGEILEEDMVPGLQTCVETMRKWGAKGEMTSEAKGRLLSLVTSLDLPPPERAQTDQDEKASKRYITTEEISQLQQQQRLLALVFRCTDIPDKFPTPNVDFHELELGTEDNAVSFEIPDIGLKHATEPSLKSTKLSTALSLTDKNIITDLSLSIRELLARDGITPDMVTPSLLVQLALYEYKYGDYQAALSCVKKAAIVGGNPSKMDFYLGCVALGLQRFKEAITRWKSSLEKQQYKPEVAALVGAVHIQLGEIEAAERYLKRVHQAEPRIETAKCLAVCYKRLDNPEKIPTLLEPLMEQADGGAKFLLAAPALDESRWTDAMSFFSATDMEDLRPKQLTRLLHAANEADAQSGSAATGEEAISHKEAVTRAFTVVQPMELHHWVELLEIVRSKPSIDQGEQLRIEQAIADLDVERLELQMSVGISLAETEPRKAIRYLLRAAEDPANEAEALKLCLSANRILGEEQAEITLLERLHKKGALGIDDLRALLNYQEINGQTQRSLVTLQSIINEDPENVADWGKLASSLGELNYTDKSQQVHRKVLKLAPGNIDSLLALGNILLAKHEYIESLDLAVKALKSEPNSHDALLLKALVLLETDNIEEALGVAQAAVEQERSPRALRALGLSHFKTGQIEKAEEPLREALTAAPDDPEILGSLTRLLITQDKIDAALKLAERAVEANPEDNELSLVVVEAYLAAGNHKKALQLAEIACKKDETDARGWLLQAKAQDQSNDRVNAETSFRHAAELDPSLKEAWEWLLNVAETSNNALKIVRFAEPLLGMEPDNADLWRKVGQAHSKLGTSHDALIALDRAVRAGDNSRETLSDLITLATQLSETEKLVDYLERAVGKGDVDIALQLQLIDGYFQLGREETARRELEAVNMNQIHDAGQIAKLADQLISLGLYQNAVDLLSRQTHTHDDNLISKLGDAYRWLGRLEDAVEAYKKALAIDSSNHELWAEMGFCHESLGNREQATESYKHALEHAEKNADTRAAMKYKGWINALSG